VFFCRNESCPGFPLACSVLIYFGLVLGSSKMGVQEERERRRELLLMALEAYPDPEQAL